MPVIRGMPLTSSFAMHSRQLQQRLLPITRRASTVAPPKPRLLEKPERFNPPSHGQRVRPKKPITYGAPLSAEQKEMQQRKQYPHMMPPRGSFLFWFLTNRMIHVFITTGILLSLVFGTWFQNFVHNTPFKDLLPPNSMFFAHPIQFITQYTHVYGLHVEWNTAQVMEKRKQQTDDVARRAEYRKAHGLDSGEKAGLFGGWTARSDDQMLGPAPRTGYDPATNTDLPIEAPVSVPERKKWLGIW